MTTVPSPDAAPGRRPRRVLAWAAACALASLPSAEGAHAAGFFIQEQSARDMGSAFAGASALAEDAATIFYNPAGLTRLEGPTVQAAGFLIAGRADLDDEGTTATTPGSGGLAVPVGGGGGGDPFGPIPTGNLYAALPVMAERLEGRLWAGFGLSAPFGLEARYDDDWYGRYDSTDSALRTFDLAPTLAVAITDWLSLGASLNVQYADAYLENRLPDPLAVGGPSPDTDGELEVDGDDWSVGFSAGVHLEPVAGTRFGVAYRYGISHELEGTAKFSRLTGPLAVQNGRFDAKADLDLPDIVMVGLAQDLGERWTLLAQFNWFEWSSFDEIRVKIDDGTELVSPQDYDDSVSAMVGLRYRWSDALQLRTGFQFDETPTTDGRRSTRTPDANRYWLAVGASYELGERFRPLGAHLGIDFGYAHIFVEDTEIRRADDFYDDVPLIASSVTTRADVVSSIDLFTLQLRARF